MERKWMVGLEIQFHSFKKPIVFWSTDGKKGVNVKNEEGVLVFRSQESKKAVIWVFVSVHVSILWVRFQLFPLLFGFKDNNSKKWTIERIPCFDEKKVGIWTTRWLFPLIISSRLYSDTHQCHWLKGWVLSSVFKKRIKINLFAFSNCS